VIVRVRPGEHPYARINRFGFGLDNMENAQILAAQGYAAYYPGFSADSRDPMKQFAAAVIPAVNALIDLGIADPERLGVLGFSYGSYCVLGLITQTDRFKAAVAQAGITNFSSFYSQMPRSWFKEGEGSMSGAMNTSRILPCFILIEYKRR